MVSLLGGFHQVANSVDKNSKKSTGTLDSLETPAIVDSSKHKVVIAIKSVRIVPLVSDLRCPASRRINQC